MFFNYGNLGAATVAEPITPSDKRTSSGNVKAMRQPKVSSAVVHPKASAVPFAAVLGGIGVTVVGGLLAVLLKPSRKKSSSTEKAAAATPSAIPATATRPVPQRGAMAVNLSPFGSPVGSTPIRLPIGHKPERMRPRYAPSDSDADDQSDNASIRDQRQTNLVDPAQLQKTLKQMQEMAEENRKLSAFLAEYKADAEKLTRLEEENKALRNVTRQLEVELQELKTNTLPRTGAELEVFKKAVKRAPAVSRSVCSNDETLVLGVTTASLDGGIPDARGHRTSVFKQLLATLQGTASAAASQASTPRGNAGGPTARAGTSGSTRHQRRQPDPEEAAVIGQAVYQLLDQFGGRMM